MALQTTRERVCRHPSPSLHWPSAQNPLAQTFPGSQALWHHRQPHLCSASCRWVRLKKLDLRAGGVFFLYLKGHRLPHDFSLCSRKQRPSLLPWSHRFSLWVPGSPPVLNDRPHPPRSPPAPEVFLITQKCDLINLSYSGQSAPGSPETWSSQSQQDGGVGEPCGPFSSCFHLEEGSGSARNTTPSLP